MAQQPTTLVVTDLDHARVAAVAGELDLATAADFERALLKALKGADLVIDLSACTFLDSAAITALVAAMREATRRSRRLTMVRPAGHARATIELTGISDAVETYAERAQAVRALTA